MHNLGDKSDNFSSENNISENEVYDEKLVREMLGMQISECEMLQSMFPNPDELFIDYGVLVDIQDFLSTNTSQKPPQLNFTINLNVCNWKLEIIVNLPSEYPSVKPEVFIRCDQLSRNQQKALNANVESFISNFDRDELILGSIIAWLQDHAPTYFSSQGNECGEKVVKESVNKEKIFNRLWIYSHHIYNKVKRKIILDLAQEFLLTGFCLPGKPGIICIEGYKEDCQEWWQQIKSLTWKKIMCISKEENPVDSNIDDLRKFSDFQEISFNEGRIKKQDHHMDFGEFHKYLKENNCDYIFKVYFGMDGK